MTFAPETGEHPSETSVAEYLDGRLTPAERDRVEAHFARCKLCREEMLGARQFLRQRGRPRRLIAGGSVIAVAAALVLMVQLPGTTPPSDTTRDVMRAAGTTTPLIAYGPIGDVSSRPLRFTWGATPNVATYRITVSAENGRTLWSRSTSDTVATLPDSVALTRDQRYHWVVDALLGDGATRSTGLREFRVVP